MFIAGGEKMYLRKYKSSDCKCLTELFYDTVHTVNAKDYTKEQLDAWAPYEIDLIEWDKSLSEHYSIVAVQDDIVVGFGDIDKSGYLDRLYVHKDYQRQGIATAVCNELEDAVNSFEIFTYASVTAKPFFEKRGYKIVSEQRVVRNGVYLTNYKMIF